MSRKILFIITLIIVMSACARDQSEIPPITKPAEPDKGKATVYGQVIEKTSGEPIADIVVRLAEVHREGEGGVFLLDLANSPGTRTDEKGEFILANFPPGEYVMAIGDGDNINDYDVIEDTKTGKPKVWTAVADQAADWGINKAEILFR
jgi:hypothetical protein